MKAVQLDGRATRVYGTVCFTGMVSNEWTIRDFYPIEYIPTGVRLTAYGEMDEIVEVHRTMESNAAMGKMVVRVKH